MLKNPFEYISGSPTFMPNSVQNSNNNALNQMRQGNQTVTNGMLKNMEQN